MDLENLPEAATDDEDAASILDALIRLKEPLPEA